MSSKKYIVAYLDILGYKNMVKEYSKSRNQVVLTNIFTIVNDIIDFNKSNPKYATEVYKKWKSELFIKSFSDCFCVAIPFEIENVSLSMNIKLFYQHIALFQILFLHKDFLLRGGISVGSFIFDDNLLFSDALIEAYELESQQAVFPRIVVSEKLLKEINTIDKEYFEYMFVKEQSQTFINPFNYILVDNREANNEIEQLEKELVGLGSMINDLECESKKEKLKLVEEIKNKMLTKLKKTSDINVVNKIQWVIDFCDFQLSNSNERFSTNNHQ